MYHSRYGEVTGLCRETGVPVYLVKEGERELAVMEMDSYRRLQKKLYIKENMLEALMRSASELSGDTAL